MMTSAAGARNMRRASRREVLFLLVIVAVAMLVRGAFTALPRVVRWDEAAYQLIARSLLEGRGYYELVGARDLQQPPVVAYLSVAGRGLGLPIPWATAALAHVLLGGLIPVPVYLLGRDLKSQRTGALAALLVALHPALAVSPLYWSTMTEPPYVLFLLIAVYAAWQTAQRGQWRWAVTAGAAFGLAYLTRPEALAYLVAMGAFIVVWRMWPCRQHLAWRERRLWCAQQGPRLLGQLAVVAAIFLLILSPYAIYLHRVTGRWAFSGKQGISMDIAWAYAQRSQAEHDRVAAGLDDTGKEIVWLSAEQYDVTLLGWIRQDPGRFIQLVRHNVVAFTSALFAEDLFQPWQVVLMTLGAFATPWTRRRAVREGFLLLVLASMLALLVFFILSRFMAFVVPIGMLWAAEGLEVTFRWAAGTGALLRKGGHPLISRAFGALPVVILAGAAMLLLLEGASVVTHEQAGQPFYRIETARWLTQHLPPGSRLMVRSSEIALYANLPAVAFPNAPWEQVRAYGAVRGAAYLVIEDKEIRSLRPGLAPLLDDPVRASFPGLRPVAQLEGGGRTTLVFALD
jgi:4-amino-4-deoxy-L-arabinose transferase-like glycosyltransferase